MKTLRRNPEGNLNDSLVEGIVNNMGYSDPDVLFPDTDPVKPGDGVDYEWFMPAYAGLGAESELSAIKQYTTQSACFGRPSTELMGVAIVEMQHYDKVGDLILKLGGTLDKVWNSTEVEYGKTPKEAIGIAIQSEKTAIKFYEDLQKKISSLPKQTTTSEICISFLSKLLADEKHHLHIFQHMKID